jgi:hypothetical protein
MKEEVTHKRSGCSEKGRIYTIKALCGYFESYDMGYNKKFQTPFISTPDYTCEDCKAAYAMEVLGNLP